MIMSINTVGVKKDTSKGGVKPLWERAVISKPEAYWLACGYRWAKCGSSGDAAMEPQHVPDGYLSVFAEGMRWYGSVKGSKKAAATKWVMEFTR